MTPNPPIAAFSFTVNVKGDDAPGLRVSEVSGLDAPPGDALKSGGENRHVHRLPAAAVHASLVCKRGLAAPDAPIIDWARETIEGALAKKIQTKDLIVTLIDATGAPVAIWTVGHAFPVKWEIGRITAAQNEVAFETLEFAFTTLTRNP